MTVVDGTVQNPSGHEHLFRPHRSPRSLIRKIPSGWTRTYIFIEYLLVSHYWKLLNLNLLFERRYVLKRAHEPKTWVES